jgi:hypothetical protein
LATLAHAINSPVKVYFLSTWWPSAIRFSCRELGRRIFLYDAFLSVGGGQPKIHDLTPGGEDEDPQFVIDPDRLRQDAQLQEGLNLSGRKRYLFALRFKHKGTTFFPAGAAVGPFPLDNLFAAEWAATPACEVKPPSGAVLDQGADVAADPGHKGIGVELATLNFFQ